MTRVYGPAEVHAALPWPALANALAGAFAAGAHVPVRHAHALDGDDALLLMPAWNDRVLGTKVVTVMPGNVARGVGTVQAVYLLMDRTTGETLAVLDGEALTLRRTAAASALAARWMARAESSRLLVVGTGRLAGWMARAHLALSPGLAEVAVWGRRPQAARALADDLATAQELYGRRVYAVEDLPDAVSCADIICCVTTATTPVVRGAWLRPGQHLDLVGAFKPSMREVDDDAVAMSRIVVDTRAGALREAGDLVQAIAAGRLSPDGVAGELADLVTGRIPGRRSVDEITLFKSVGTALEDLAAAALVVPARP